MNQFPSLNPRTFAGMPVEQISLECFLELRKSAPVLDVRSPGEFNHAHIPGAHACPLFTDEERKIVGAAYKQQSREIAIKTGLQFFAPKMVRMVENVERLTGRLNDGLKELSKKTILVHCWRGGMRSAGVAWLLDLYGFRVCTLTGGYKVFRKWVLKQFEKTYSFKIIGGYTGSGKTEILRQLKMHGEKIIDLEALVAHKGSAFGNLNGMPQPSQEMFENNLALALNEAAGDTHPIWLEDESQRIGDLNIPSPLYRCKQCMPVYFVDIPFEERLQHIIINYGGFKKESLLEAIMRIKKRLGPQETKNAINFLEEDKLSNCFEVLLKYYDKAYAKNLLQLNEQVICTINCSAVNAEKNTGLLLHEIKDIS